MREIYSKAVVLGRKDTGEFDGIVSVFSEDYGKISARAKSIRKITSKLSSHLQPMQFIKARFLRLKGERGIFSMLDCVSDDEFSKYNTKKRDDLIQIVSFLDKFLLDLNADRKLWFFLTEIFKKKYAPKDIAKALFLIIGLDSEKEKCGACSSGEIFSYSIKMESFLCKRCASANSADDMLYLSR